MIEIATTRGGRLSVRDDDTYLQYNQREVVSEEMLDKWMDSSRFDSSLFMIIMVSSIDALRSACYTFKERCQFIEK